MMDPPWVDGPLGDAPEPPPVDDVLAALRRSLTTAQNDDLSEPMSEKRKRHVLRQESIRDAIATIERLHNAAVSSGELQK